MISTQFLQDWREFFRQTKGRIVGIEFQKADGTVRTMSARMGVYHPKNSPPVQGIHDRESQDLSAGTLTVYDMNADKKDNIQKGGYRRFRFDRLRAVTFQGKRFPVSLP